MIELCEVIPIYGRKRSERAAEQNEVRRGILILLTIVFDTPLLLLRLEEDRRSNTFTSPLLVPAKIIELLRFRAKSVVSERVWIRRFRQLTLSNTRENTAPSPPLPPVSNTSIALLEGSFETNTFLSQPKATKSGVKADDHKDVLLGERLIDLQRGEDKIKKQLSSRLENRKKRVYPEL